MGKNKPPLRNQEGSTKTPAKAQPSIFIINHESQQRRYEEKTARRAFLREFRSRFATLSPYDPSAANLIQGLVRRQMVGDLVGQIGNQQWSAVFKLLRSLPPEASDLDLQHLLTNLELLNLGRSPLYRQVEISPEGPDMALALREDSFLPEVQAWVEGVGGRLIKLEVSHPSTLSTPAYLRAQFVVEPLPVSEVIIACHLFPTVVPITLEVEKEVQAVIPAPSEVSPELVAALEVAGVQGLFDVVPNREELSGLREFLLASLALGYACHPIVELQLTAFRELRSGLNRALQLKGVLSKMYPRRFITLYLDGQAPVTPVQVEVEVLKALDRDLQTHNFPWSVRDLDLQVRREGGELFPVYTLSYLDEVVFRGYIAGVQDAEQLILNDVLEEIRKNPPSLRPGTNWVNWERRDVLATPHYQTRALGTLRILATLVISGKTNDEETKLTAMHYAAAKGGYLFFEGKAPRARAYYMEFYRLAYQDNLYQLLTAEHNFEYAVIARLLATFWNQPYNPPHNIGNTDEEMFVGQVMAAFKGMERKPQIQAMLELAALDHQLPFRILQHLKLSGEDHGFAEELVRELLDAGTQETHEERFRVFSEMLVLILVAMFQVEEYEPFLREEIPRLMTLFKRLAQERSLEPFLGLQEALRETRFEERAKNKLGIPMNANSRRALPDLERVRFRLTRFLAQLQQGFRLAARLQASFTHKEVPFGVETAVELVIRNVGTGYASEIKVENLTARGCSLVGDPGSIASIPPNSEERLELRLTSTSSTGSELVGFITYVGGSSAQDRLEELFSGLFRSADVSAAMDFANPYYAASGMKDSNVFYGRRNEITKIIETIQSRHQYDPIIIHGRRKVGKTSMLFRILEGKLQDYMPPDDLVVFTSRHRSVYIDFEGMREEANENEVYLAIAKGLYRHLGLVNWGISSPRNAEWFDSKRAEYLFEDFMEEVRTVVEKGNKRVILMLDEFDTIIDRLGKKDWFFGVFRRLFTDHSTYLAPIMAGQERLVQMLEQYADRLYGMTNIRVEISPLDRGSSLRLIEEPMARACPAMSWDSGVKEALFDLTQGYPFYIQSICSELVDRMKRIRSLYITQTDLREAVIQVVDRNVIPDLSDYWRLIRTATGRAVARVVARTGDKNETITFDEIHHELRKANNKGVAKDVQTALDELVALYVLSKTQEAGNDLYSFRIPLLGRWIHRTYSLNTLTQMMREELASHG